MSARPWDVNGVLRRAGAMAFAIPRRFLDLVDEGSIHNARREVKGGDRRRELSAIIEGVAGSDVSETDRDEAH